ncbi:MAG TPA: hypothetical protein VFU89_07245 [Rhabdochlamydiaceae bacterium]|nr:hypothetical protein [Rhabdochlamydiaceae bacterium]
MTTTTPSPPPLTAATWRSWILHATAPPSSKNEHLWICYTYNDQNVRIICVYSPEKYREECSKNSFWKTRCKKMPLKKIIAIAQELKIKICCSFNTKLTHGRQMSPVL